MTTYISITVEDMKTKLFLKTNDLKFTQQKFKLKNQRNKCFIKAVAILPSTAIYPQRLFCRELFVIGQS